MREQDERARRELAKEALKVRRQLKAKKKEKEDDQNEDDEDDEDDSVGDRMAQTVDSHVPAHVRSRARLHREGDDVYSTFLQQQSSGQHCVIQLLETDGSLGPSLKFGVWLRWGFVIPGDGGAQTSAPSSSSFSSSSGDNSLIPCINLASAKTLFVNEFAQNTGNTWPLRAEKLRTPSSQTHTHTNSEHSLQGCTAARRMCNCSPLPEFFCFLVFFFVSVVRSPL
jgi:hypothetical protein